LPVPNELIIFCFDECIASDHVGEGEGGVPTGFDDEWVGVVGLFPRRDGEFGRGGADEFFVEV
jgi:hypothetical protein